MMDKVVSVITAKPSENRLTGGDSTTDRLSSVYTFYLLISFAAFVQFSQIFGDPVQCWCPAHFTGTHSEYTNKACWTRNTYYLPHSENVPKDGLDREYVSYYQWVGLMLAFQAMLFFAPRPIWRNLSSFSGVAVSTITDAAIKCDASTSKEEREKHIEYIVQHLNRFLSKLGTSCVGRFRGQFLPVTYMLIKVLYFANIIFQLFLLNQFLGTDYNYYGLEIMNKMANGEAWLNSGRFPRVTLCDFKIRLLGNVHRYTVQCSLPMNLFNEIIFIFIWFWFVFVAAMTTGSFLIRIILLIPFFNKRFVRKRLIAMKKINQNGEKDNPFIDRFVNRYLKGDGCFILRMISKNASDMLAGEIISGLWDKFESTGNKKPAQNGYRSTDSNVKTTELGMSLLGREPPRNV